MRPRTRDSTLPTCLKLIRESVTRDESSVLSALDRSLDEIDLTMSQDILIRHDLLQWKGLLSRWRNLLFHQTKSLKRLQKSIDLKTEDEFSAQLFTEILEENHTLRERVDSVAQSLMSTMSIVESERVIQQTEAVSKLTSLAFFFIPLTLVASLFGMNVVVSPLNRQEEFLLRRARNLRTSSPPGSGLPARQGPPLQLISYYIAGKSSMAFPALQRSSRA